MKPTTTVMIGAETIAILTGYSNVAVAKMMHDTDRPSQVRETRIYVAYASSGSISRPEIIR